MNLIEILLIALGLSADAFAVSICKGAECAPVRNREPVISGLWFGMFQGLMPVIGFFLGSTFVSLISSVSPWIVFIILTVIGVNMIREGFQGRKEGPDTSRKSGFGAASMFASAIATSIDALAIGVTFSMAGVKILSAFTLIPNVFTACLIIALTTFVLSFAGTKIGSAFGSRHKFASELAGGTVLIFIGLKTLAEHLGLVGFMEQGDIVFGLLLPFAACVVGAAYVLVTGGAMNDILAKALTGFAAGVMTAVSLWSLLIPAGDLASSRAASGGIPMFIPLIGGFWFGILTQLALDRSVPHMHNFSSVSEGPESDISKSAKIALAAAIHHASEGVGLGVILAGYFVGNTGISFLGAVTVIIGMSLQNIPESAVESVPIKAKGEQRSKSFFLSVLSGSVEPILALVTLIIACAIPDTIPYIMSYSAAAMLYIVVEELIPGMMGGEHRDRYVVSFAAGFSLMMLISTVLR